jgi:N-carbamoyl-L-amino-acid hydrolase
MTMTIALDTATMLAQLTQLGAIGQDASGGRTRLAFSDADKQGRDQLVAWMHDLSLDITIDQIGNIFGTLAGSDYTLAPLMIGSHIDTVINAGLYDGCYGVLAGLAVLRALRSAGIVPRRSIVVAAFSNEEGVRYQPDMMGSLVYAGGIDVAQVLDVIGTDGTRLGDELARIGYAGDLRPSAVVPHAYLELHIEQGPLLEAQALQIGVVADLQGISWQQITINGVANHAGTTPLAMRHDAGWAAAEVITQVRRMAYESGSTLATVGAIQFCPNAINVIPQTAVLTLDMRDPDDQKLTAAEAHVVALLQTIAAQEGVTITSQQLVRFPAVHFDESLVAEIAQATAALGLSHRQMTSGAGHDAQMLARIAPAAMIFVPSQAGISHNPAEYTSDADLIAGATVLLAVVQRLSV